MKFMCDYIDGAISFYETEINTIVIENQIVFRKIIKDIFMGITDDSSFCILSEDNTPCQMSKNAELVTDFMSFDMNRKSLINAVLSSLEKEALSETCFAETNKLLSTIEKYIQNISFPFDCNIECKKISVSSLLKSAGIEISDDYENSLERLVDYFGLIREFEKNKLFITVNMRSYYSDEEMQSFFYTIINHRFKLLMIESADKKLLENEKRIIIDHDMCVIDHDMCVI